MTTLSKLLLGLTLGAAAIGCTTSGGYYDGYEVRSYGYDRDSRYDGYSYGDDYYRDRDDDYYGDDVIRRERIGTPYNADILVAEELSDEGYGRDERVCTVAATGPDAEYLSHDDLHRVAEDVCSHGAHVHIAM